MRKRITVTCPKCGNSVVSGWYNEHDIRYNIKCEACGHSEQVMNIKYVEAFPEWFKVEEFDE